MFGVPTVFQECVLTSVPNPANILRIIAIAAKCSAKANVIVGIRNTDCFYL